MSTRFQISPTANSRDVPYFTPAQVRPGRACSTGRPGPVAVPVSLTEESHFNHDFSQVPVHTAAPTMIQPKLTLGQPNDKYEQEADRVAEQVMRMPELCNQCGGRSEEDETLRTKPLAAQITPLVQRQVKPEEEEEKEAIQARLTGDRQAQRQVEEPEEEDKAESIQTMRNNVQIPQVKPGFETRIRALRSGGQPLSQSVRSFFEPRFGCDFSQVRTHTDAQAARSVRFVNARAFTMGRDIVFGAGQYAPGTITGQRLLAHELTHVLQQKGRAGNDTTENKLQRERRRGRGSGRSPGSVLMSPMIRQIDVNVTTPQYVRVHWAMAGGRTLPRRLANQPRWGGGFLSGLRIPGPFTCSTGAGRCSVNCDDAGVSQRSGTLCTPKDGCWVVNPDWTHQRTGGGLHFFVGFQRSGIALHSNVHGRALLTVDGTPHSHGCVRLPHLVAQMIYENIWPGYTTVCVHGTWSGRTCWRGRREVPRPTPARGRPPGIVV